ncbi:MAG: 50S ribosomal protein L24 [Acidobacteriota bacterium]|nr:50S ribosomal protein L24 [Acidobacteriota bacterium]
MSRIQLRKNDVVMVIKGKDKGKTGKVLMVYPEKNRVLVEKINHVKQFIRPDRSRNIQGGIMDKEAPIHVSNVLLYCPECGQGVRTRNRILEDGAKVRMCGKCESTIEKPK